LGISAQQSQLKAQHQEIKTLGLLVFLGEFRWQARDMLSQLVPLLLAKGGPGLGLAICLDESAFGPHDEIVNERRAREKKCFVQYLAQAGV
jgi:hypothetical protein